MGTRVAGSLLAVISFISVTIGYDVTTSSLDRTLANDLRCMELSTQPFFAADMVIGQPWRIYFTWNMKLENRCMDMTFKIATPEMIRRVYYDMHEYLEEQPVWGAASLMLSMGKAGREMLLFDDQGPAGRFTAVPNVMRDGNMTPERKTVPLLKFQMKLIHSGKFLIMMDCFIGVVSLAARFDESPYRSEVDAAARSLFNILGEGSHACTQDQNKNEKFLLE